MVNSKAIGELYNVDRTVITKHLQNIYKELELEENSTSAIFALVQNEGNRSIERNIKYYNLDAVISVGYRVSSDRAIQFRRCATNILKEFSKKGYIIDKKMANGAFFDEDYYDSLIAEIREIRLSERRFYQKITDIYATAVDYDKKAPTTIKFFKKVQNKMYFAASYQTTAEIIYNRSDSEKKNMGLTSWKNSPAGKISHEIACDKALTEFEKYRIKQDKLYKSDFDLLMEEVNNKKGENNE